MPSTRVRVRVPSCGSTISQMPTTTVRKAQSRRRTTVPIECAVKAPATRKPPAISRIQPMKIAVPTEATAGTRIAMQPMKIAIAPTASSGFQLFASPSRTAGSIDAPPISMPPTLCGVSDGVNIRRAIRRLYRFPLELALVETDPLAHGVVRDSVLAPDGHVTRRLDLRQQLIVGRPVDFPQPWNGPTSQGGSIPADPTGSRAISVPSILDSESTSTTLASAGHRLTSIFSPAMRVERRRAVRADDPEIARFDCRPEPR